MCLNPRGPSCRGLGINPSLFLSEAQVFILQGDAGTFAQVSKGL